MQTKTMSNKALWAGRIMSGAAVLFLAFDSIVHVLRLPFAMQSLVDLGYNPQVSLGVGLALLISLLFFVLPRTSFIGAVLITGYLGGAVATNVRVGAGAFSIIFPFIVAIFLWSGLYVASPSIRHLLGSKMNAQ
jgi:DoxX-like family